MDVSSLKNKKLPELRTMAQSLGVQRITSYKKDQLIEAIIKQIEYNSKENEKIEREKNPPKEDIQQAVNTGHDQEEDKDQSEDGKQVIEGILDVMDEGFGFIRQHDYDSGEEDVYVSPIQVRRFRLKTGDYIKGLIRDKKEKDKFAPLIYVFEINGNSPENSYKRLNFEDLKPIYPTQKIKLENQDKDITNRIIDLVAPVGKGQRGLIVSPPKTGKTTIIKRLANAIEENHPEAKIFILLIDERPEEVTDIERSVNKFTQGKTPSMKTEIVASTFDEPVENHIRLSEIVIERAKRYVEMGTDVVILLDSITRMARAYNIVTPASGKTLSGGLDPLALFKPKRFFGAARNIEKGGSLTILATCLVDTGSRMDDMIYEEFKGTGNMELHLDRDLSEMRIFPAIDIYKSGTRRDDLLLSRDAQKAMIKLRKLNKGVKSHDAMNQLMKLFNNSANNEELVKTILEIK
ncbi:MAG: transcription termination factor Rho [Tissierellia bacterium]|nr:transcription termination factor Rho [Tissierellia bacterium]